MSQRKRRLTYRQLLLLQLLLSTLMLGGRVTMTDLCNLVDILPIFELLPGEALAETPGLPEQ
jgi:hypothetical protein